MSVAPMAVEVFCSYAHEDEAWLRKLEIHLSLLKQQGLISIWHDRLIIPGTNWARAIDMHLEAASIILLLVSADFFASDYCVGVEMKRALERQEADEVLVIPILVREVNWREAPFAHLHALPTDAKPLAAWQDEETALADVAASIRRAIGALSLLTASATRAALPPIWNIPYPRNPFFLGRDTELTQTRHYLQAGQATALSQPQAISGLGGIGKTQLALEYAYRYHSDYQAVLWARAESVEALVSSYIAFATLLQLPEREVSEQDIVVQAFKNWLQAHTNWLLILDNADELALLSDFLPSSIVGHVLLTTRAVATGRLAHRLEIDALQPEPGALFLLRRAALLAPDATLDQATPQEQELALQISHELGGLPLALDQAGAYLEETGTDLTDYWHIYQKHRADLLQQRGGLVADHPAPVATTWSLSFQKVEEKNPAAADLLRLCAYLAPDAIPEEILTAGASLLGPALAPVAPDAFRRNYAIEALRAYSLVRRNPKGKTLSIHRLVQTVLQNALGEVERRTWAVRAVLAVNAAFPASEHGTWPQCERLLSHALQVAQWSETYQINRVDVGHLLHKMASYLFDRARYQEVEPLYQRALRIFEQQSGSEHLDVATVLNKQAELYQEQGKYAQAEPLYQRALRIFEQQSGSEHPDVATVLNNLAALYYRQGKYAEAEPRYQRALRIWEQQLGPQHLQVATVLIRLAALYSEQEKYVEAESLYQRALVIRQQLGPEHPDMAILFNNLAICYHKQKKYIEAEPLYHEAQRIWEQQLGPEHPRVAYSLNNLAELYNEQKKYVEAEPLYQRALYIFELQLGPEYPLVAYPLNGLALLFYGQKKYAESEQFYLRVLHIREQALGSQHPDTAETLHGLAQLWEAQGNFQEASDLYNRALAIREQALGVHHLTTTQTRNSLIALLHSMGRNEET